MREIKFRAYYQGQFYYFVMGHVWDDETKRIYFAICLDGIKFEQFSGLKDKNGREIYENDLCRADTDVVGKIVWHNAQWCWTDGGGFWPTVYGGKDGLPLMEEVTECTDLEVIGNIHDNPELME